MNKSYVQTDVKKKEKKKELPFPENCLSDTSC